MTRRIGSLAAVLLVVFGFVAAPALAAGGSVVREAVVSTIKADGSVAKTSVAQLLHLTAPAGGTTELRVPKVSDLKSYRNLSGFIGPSGEGKDYVWKTSSKLNTTTLAGFDGKLPVEVSIKYFLDGRPISADAIKHHSGDVRIEVTIANVSGTLKDVKYKAITSPVLTSAVNRYVPIQYAMNVNFPTDRWSDVGGDGSVAADGTNEIVNASGLLTPPFSNASAKVSFLGHTTDALLPRLQIFAVPGLSADLIDALQTQYDALKTLYSGTGTIGDNLEAIQDGTAQLLAGAELLLGGVGTNDAITNKPVIALDSAGNPTTLLGTLGFFGNALTKAVLPNVGSRDKTTGEGVVRKDAKGNPTTLLGSLQAQKDAYDGQLIPGMNTLVDGIDEISKQLTSGAPALTGGLTQIKSGLAQLLAKLQTNNPADPGLRDGLLAVSGGLSQLLTHLQTNDPANPGLREGLLGVSSGLSQLLATLQTNNPANPGFREGLLGVSTGLTQLLATLQTNDPSTPGFREGLVGAQQAATGAAAGFAGSDPAAAAVFGQISTGLTQLLASFGSTANPANATTVIGAIKTMSAGMTALVGSFGDATGPIDPTTVTGAIRTMVGALSQLTLSLGNASNPADQVTVIGSVKSMVTGMNGLVVALGTTSGVPSPATVIGGLELMYGGLSAQALPGVSQLVDGVLGGLDQLRGGLTNPNFTKPQSALGGKTPLTYYEECPGCFDPDSKAFDPATANAKFQPRFVETFKLFSDGVKAALPKLQSFDAHHPGLVDGLQQLSDGLDVLAAKLDTSDPKAPGLVDGLKQVRAGLKAVTDGIGSLNTLGVRKVQSGIGTKGDEIGLDTAVLKDGGAEATKSSVLGLAASSVSQTYVFDLAAQTTAAHDNAARGALIGLAVAASMLLARRVRRLDV